MSEEEDEATRNSTVIHALQSLLTYSSLVMGLCAWLQVYHLWLTMAGFLVSSLCFLECRQARGSGHLQQEEDQAGDRRQALERLKATRAGSYGRVARGLHARLPAGLCSSPS